MGGDSLGPYRERELTDIEVSLIRKLLNPATAFLAEAWRGVAQLSPEFVSMESNPQFLQLTTPNETVLVVTMSLHIGETYGLINVCIPHSTIEPLMPMLSNRYYMDTGRTRDGRGGDERVQTHMLGVPVDVRVQIGETQLTVHEVLDLAVGDTIVLRQSIRDPATVYVDGTPAFLGSVGKKNRMYAVKILREWEGDDTL